MVFAQRFLSPSVEAGEIVRRNRRMIREVARLCAECERELDASYALLRRVERSTGDGRRKGSAQATEVEPKKQQTPLT